jgi:protein gp37
MGINSKISWTDNTWNPVTGCTKISLGCANCYAERTSHRLQSLGQENYKNGFKVTIHENMLNKPFQWSKPKLIFVNSMSDLFHEDVPNDFILKVFNVICQANEHIYQILTKRPERLLAFTNDNKIAWPDNTWLGVTIEAAKYKNRLLSLKQTNCQHRFISFEPLLDDIGQLDLNEINWVIVGGETGPQRRLMKALWIDNIFKQTRAKKIPFFFKQWHSGRDITFNNQVYNEYPIFRNTPLYNWDS